MLLLLTVVADVADPVVVDRPYRCGVDVKHVYIQPRPHSTHPNATHEHTGEREEKASTRPRMQHDTPLSSRVTRVNERSTRYYTSNVLYNETETFVFLCTFVGVTAPYV